MKQYLSLAALNLFLASLGAFIISKIGHRLNLIDYPNKRSSHSVPIPKGGAVGMLIGFIATALLLNMPFYFWLTIALFSLLGLATDKFELSSKLRLFIQLFFALLFLSKFLELNNISPNILLSLFIIIYILGTTNIYNFMDGINGIAAITGLVGFGLLALFSHQTGKNNSAIILSLCMVFSCIGFLPFNIPKAKVFMGDIGSTLLGATFACLAILFSSNLLDFICIASFLFPFYVDEIITMAIRLKNKENLLQAHRKHFYQFLANSLQIPHWRISIVYGTIQALIGMGIIALRPYGISIILIALSILFICVAFSVYLFYNKYPFGRSKNTQENHIKQKRNIS